jgi:hypothetical protein
MVKKRLAHVLILLMCTFILFFTASSHAWTPKAGDIFHVTGCENGELVVPIVYLWSKPGGAANGARVVGQLSGDGRRDKGLRCQGSVVGVVQIMRMSGRTFIKVYSVVNSKVGWITDSFVGRKFDKSKCKTFFNNSQHIKNCIGK